MGNRFGGQHFPAFVFVKGVRSAAQQRPGPLLIEAQFSANAAFDWLTATQEVRVSIGIQNVHALLRHVPFCIHFAAVSAEGFQHFVPKRIILETPA